MVRPSLADLQVFAAVARHRSFRRAALDCGVSASALSHALRSLEERLGVQLLHRTTRSVGVTEAGAQLLARLTPALSEVDAALESINQFRDSPRGTLRINAPRPACELVLNPLVVRFLQTHPDMQVELVSDDAFVDIVSEGFDAGVRYGESLQLDMVAVPLGPPQSFAVVGSPAFLARHGRPASPQDIVRLPCIRIRFPSGRFYRWEFERGQERLEVEVQGPLAASDIPVMLHAAEAGLGLAYTYRPCITEAVSRGRLETVLDDWCPEGQGFYLYYPSRRLMPAGLRAFVEMLKAEQRGETAGSPAAAQGSR